MWENNNWSGLFNIGDGSLPREKSKSRPNMEVNVHITHNWRKNLIVIYLILKKKNVGIELITVWDHLVTFGKSQIRGRPNEKSNPSDFRIKKSSREIEHQIDGKHLQAQLLMICLRPQHEILSKFTKWLQKFHLLKTMKADPSKSIIALNKVHV